MLGENFAFGGYLREAQEVMLQGFVPDEAPLFFELRGAEGFQLRISETAVESGEDGFGRFYFRGGRGGEI